MIKMASLPSPPPTLQKVKQQFVQWRATRTKLEKIPPHLWEAVKPLVSCYSVTRLRAELRLTYRQLQTHLGHELKKASFVRPSPFVEASFVPLPPCASVAKEDQSPPGLFLELTRADGTILKINRLETQQWLCVIDRFLGA